ncbi:hypothetical protein K9M48_00240 [Candidatus Gracilibacteria bacterium]|nr:hypothetical protein [Candidatus Gracilibacteria bacterium]
MKEDISIELFEGGLSPVEDIRDKISFQLHELFSFYEDIEGLNEDENQII